MEEIYKINSSITPAQNQDQHPQTHSKKRKLSSADLRTSSSVKIRALVRQLRPLFLQFQNMDRGAVLQRGKYVVVEIEAGGYLSTASVGKALGHYRFETVNGYKLVLQTPDFRNCKAAHELQMQLKLLMDLYKQMNVKIECQTFSVESVPGFKSSDRQDGKAPVSLQFKQHDSQYAQNETIAYIESKMKVDDGQPRDSYVVGGSVFGWNFITFRGSAPVYYGVSKESFRISRTSISSQRGDSPR